MTFDDIADPVTDFSEIADPVESERLRVMAYGPVVGEYHRDAMVGPQGNRLQPYDAAVSPNLLDRYPVGSWIDVNGRPHRVADYSYYHPGRPTRNTIEVRDTPDQGYGQVRGLTGDEIRQRIGAQPSSSVLAGSPTAASVDPYAAIAEPVGAQAEEDPYAAIAEPLGPPPGTHADITAGAAAPSGIPEYAPQTVEVPAAAAPEEPGFLERIKQRVLHPEFAEMGRGLREPIPAIAQAQTVPEKALAQIPLGEEPLLPTDQRPYGFGTQFERRVAEQLSGLTSPKALATLPLFAVPGVGEVYAASRVGPAADAAKKVYQMYQESGMSPETQTALADALAEGTMVVAPVLPSRLLRKGEPHAVEPSIPQVEARAAPLGVEEGPSREVPAAGYRNIPVGEAERAEPGRPIPQEFAAVQRGEGVPRPAEAPEAVTEAPPEIPPEDLPYAGVPGTQAEVGRAREVRGADPYERALRQSWGEAVDVAKVKSAEVPEYGENLAAEIASNPRTPSPDEHVTLLKNWQEKEAAYDRAIKSGDQDALATAKADVEQAWDALDKGGTQWGRSGAIRQMVLDQFYTPTRMRAEMKAAGMGKELTPREEAQIATVHEEMQAAKGGVSAKEGQRTADAAMAEKMADRIRRHQADIDSAANEARQSILQERGSLKWEEDFNPCVL
jgi:hypothetical protein